MQFPSLYPFKTINGRLASNLVSWATDGNATIDVRQDKSGLSTIGGFFVDNSGNNSAVTFNVTVTGQSLTVPQGAVGTIPIFMQTGSVVLISNGGSGATGTGATNIIASEQTLPLALVQSATSGLPQIVTDTTLQLASMGLPAGTAVQTIGGYSGIASASVGSGAVGGVGTLLATLAPRGNRAWIEAQNQDNNAYATLVLDDGGGNNIYTIFLSQSAPDGSGGGSWANAYFKGRARMYSNSGSPNFGLVQF